MLTKNLKVEKKSSENKNQQILVVEGPQELAEKIYSVALREIADSVDVPGFRKGKAPRDIIEKQVGVGYISQRAFEGVFYELLYEVSQQEGLDVVDIVEISSFNLTSGQPLTFTVVVELKPEVKLGNYKNLKVKAKKISYDKEQFISKTLDKLVNNLVTYSKDDNAKLTEGDLVVLDFEGTYEDGTEVPGAKVENFQTILEKDKFLPEFVEKLVGLKVGEDKSFQIIFPENYASESAGKKANFKAKIHAIEKRVLPEVNDELAIKLGMADLNDLNEKILAQMKDLQNIGSQRELENKIVEEIVKNSKYEISEKMIDSEINFLLKDLKAQCEKQGINWSAFKADEKNKELFQKARDAGINRISIDLVLNEIVKRENIVVSEDEIKAEVNNRITQLGDKYKHLENDKSFRHTVRTVISRNKAIDFLINQNEPIWEEEVIKLTT